MARTAMTPGWEHWLDESVAWPVISAVSKDVADDTQRRAHRITGDLAGSYLVRRVGRLPRARIGSHLEYGVYEELGTKPHTITARRKKALAWPGGSPRRSVNHPGQRAHPHLRPALFTRRVLRRVVML